MRSTSLRSSLLPRASRRQHGFGWAMAVHLVLALVLLFGQREATLHWLSHATEAATAKHSLVAASDVCDECLSLAGLDSVVHPAPVVAPGADAAPLPLPDMRWVSAQSLLLLGYASRGPPSRG